MALIRILLIDDSPGDVDSFCRAIKRVSSDVVVVDVPSMNAAMHALKDDRGFDFIFIDSMLQQTIGFKESIQALVEYAPVHVLTSDRTAPSFQKFLQAIAAKTADVDLVGRNDHDALMALVERLIREKSGGNTTIRVEQARLEGKVARLEEGQKDIKQSLTEQLKMVQQLANSLSDFNMRLTLSVDQIRQQVEQTKIEICQLRDELHDVSIVAETAAKAHHEVDDEAGNKAALQIMLAVIAAITAIFASPVLLHIVQVVLPNKINQVQQQVQPSPSPSTSKGEIKKEGLKK